MTLDSATVLGIIYLLSELPVLFIKRAEADAASATDRGSLRLIWTVIGIAVASSFFLSHVVTGAAMGAESVLQPAGIALFAAGLILRWSAILYLGRFFTVNVAIAADHRIVDSGPYRWIRHPSYTGALAAFAGMALCIGNWVSLAVMLIPIVAVFAWRMRIEEAALLQALGAPYRQYMSRTKRLIPAIY
ncbi:MAG TPA: isoprenylcysteine carboxylmethyltransferase family protein [Steroidobacteraceae bacterium]|jgi:protein-S-isoprenylcysteine O-methyltransferase|nr:isoprenylcysteine carboxylmethyltransferase family protein [Steroidobacteraceae bacterium]